MARTKDFDELEILDKAISIFWRRGYNGTSMEELVNGLGISRSSLYDTYGNKHSLFVKALERSHTKALHRMNRILHQFTSAKEAIKQLLELTKGDLVGDLKQDGCFWVNAAVEIVPYDQEVENIIALYNQQVEGVFCSALTRGQDKGEIPLCINRMATSRFFVSTVKGLSVVARSKTDNFVFDDTINVAMSVIDE
ncbi:MAG: TetR/AcrR family transcriptional regulator [Bacteroidota bacterium]|nr:TetR/AcrR family transcriptional regulator [Bacteroidota bacterium]